MFQKEHTSENVQLDVYFGVKDGTLGKHETSPLCNLSLSGAVVQVRDLSFSREIVTTPLVRTAERFGIVVKKVNGRFLEDCKNLTVSFRFCAWLM